MIVNKEDLTPKLLKEVLHYEPATGYLTWCSKIHSKRVVVSSRAGSIVPSTGYRSINVFGRSYLEHRLIWFMVKGKWPDGDIDHINHDRADNRISNLRDVPHAENMRNQSAMRGTVTGESGVWYNKRNKHKKYVAEITKYGKKLFQKSYATASEAAAAREAKLIELGFHENHGTSNKSI